MSVRKLVFPNQYLLLQFIRTQAIFSPTELNSKDVQALVRHTQYQHLHDGEIRLMKRLLPVGGNLADVLESGTDDARVELYLQMLLKVYAYVRSGDVTKFNQLMSDGAPVAPILTQMFCQSTVVDADIHHFWNQTLKKPTVAPTLDGFSKMSAMHELRMQYVRDPRVLKASQLEHVGLPSILAMLSDTNRLLRASIAWVVMSSQQRFKFLLQLMRDTDTKDLLKRKMVAPRPTRETLKYVNELKKVQTKLNKEADFRTYFAFCARQSMGDSSLKKDYLEFLLLEQPRTSLSDLRTQVETDTKLLSGVNQLPPGMSKTNLLLRREDLARFVSYRAQLRFVFLHSIESPDHVDFLTNHNYSWETFRTLNRTTFPQISQGIEDARKILAAQ